MYEKAMREAGVEDVGECYFVGMNFLSFFFIQRKIKNIILKLNSVSLFFMLADYLLLVFQFLRGQRRFIYQRSRRP